MKLSRNQARKRRKLRIRKKISGTGERPRLAVFRSNNHIYAQLINDREQKTLAASSSLALPAVKGLNKSGAFAVGKDLAERAAKHNIQAVVFDRSGYYFHGRIKAVADGAREGGLKF
ncbi:MAG: 50S ribosomal protein L18 [Desulfovermiculus sp.]|nr:50S ribosomal protein L18 [Desulfovermiculus sp.]